MSMYSNPTINPYARNVYGTNNVIPIAEQAQEDNNEMLYSHPTPGNSVYSDNPSDFGPQDIVSQVRQAQANRVKQKAQVNAAASPIYGKGAETKPTPEMNVFAIGRQAKKEALDSGELWNIQAPNDNDIHWGMWLGSILATLFVGAESGNGAAAISAGGLAALTIHDEGYARQERSHECQKMLDEGYSYDAVYQWYTSGDNKSLKDDRERMEKAREANLTAQNNMAIAQMNAQGRIDAANITANSRLQAAQMANGDMSGFNGGNSNSQLTPDTFKTLERTPDGRTSSAGAKGVYQITPDFWNQYKPSGAPSDVSQATDGEQRQAVQNYINQAQAAGYTPEQIVVGYQHGLNPNWKNNPNWEASLAGSPAAREYLNYYRTNFENAGNTGSPTFGYTVGYGKQRQQYVPMEADNGQIVYANPTVHGSGANAFYQTYDPTTGALGTINQNAVHNVGSSAQRATQGEFLNTLEDIRNGNEEGLMGVAGLTGGLGSPVIGAGINAALNGRVTPVYEDINYIQGLNTQQGLSQARANGQSGINTQGEIETARKAARQLNFSSVDALRNSALKEEDSYLAVHNLTLQPNGDVTDQSGNVVAHLSPRNAAAVNSSNGSSSTTPTYGHKYGY